LKIAIPRRSTNLRASDAVVTSFTNAAGYVSNGILLLGPASPAQVAPPDGGVLDVFFVAEGTQTGPRCVRLRRDPLLTP
jgi:hypothetical protein